ncbi:AAA family ATPase [Gluconobacter kondonii]|uniref:AAA family ATPase n=1 Tax=Gluconobacter kondonii TaxID=941463 RepID=UPI001B8B4855|nr:AAA family ATPase [Gluconobacter kondonii]MBS1081172.1 AAA family ATPase [Gluconobacter kondonii]
MKLRRLEISNFRSVENLSLDFHPNFNVLIGVNGAGKTTVLEAAAVALSGWLISFPGSDPRPIRATDVRRVEHFEGSRYRSLPQFPVTVSGYGELNLPSGDFPTQIQWTRSLERQGGRTTSNGAREIKQVASTIVDQIRSGTSITLPVVRYFGAGRLWEPIRETEKRRIRRNRQITESEEETQEINLEDPFYGYRLSIDKRANAADFIRWIGEERRNEIDLDEPSVALGLVRQAILTMLPELSAVRYELRRRTIVLELQDGRNLIFGDLSDGYRNVIALAADLAIKMTMLNPHLQAAALVETPGVVLIDELDLHLHPTWQRRIAEDLRRTFPKVQFICTSHSPFVVQSLRSGEELIVLGGETTSTTANKTLEEVAEGLMGVSNAETAERYDQMKNTARRLLEEMEQSDLSTEEKFERFRLRLAEATGPYADNPAYQAYLEMQLAARRPLGEE